MHPVVAPRARATAVTPARNLTLHIAGFAGDRALVDGAVALARRRHAGLVVTHDGAPGPADVVLLDGGDAAALRWASQARWLPGRAVIWVDAPACAPVAPGHVRVGRPVHWPLLPLMLERALERRPLSGDSTAAAGRAAAQVLVATHSLGTRSYLRAVLEPLQLRVVEADCGAAALDALAAGPVACVLVDACMPGADAFAACRRIKAAGDAAPPVVLLTEPRAPLDILRGKLAGCDAWLAKPLEPGQLQRTLRQVMGLDDGPVQAAAAAG